MSDNNLTPDERPQEPIKPIFRGPWIYNGKEYDNPDRAYIRYYRDLSGYQSRRIAEIERQFEKLARVVGTTGKTSAETVEKAIDVIADIAPQSETPSDDEPAFLTYLCIKPACPETCDQCNHAISPQQIRDYAIAHAMQLRGVVPPNDLLARYEEWIKTIPVGEENKHRGASAYNWHRAALHRLRELAAETGGSHE